MILKNIINTKTNIDKYKRTLKDIKTSIQSDHSHAISSNIITPRFFIESLQKIKDARQIDTLFGIQLSNYHISIKLSEINLFLY